jgi:tRNA CCA-adding enzyme
MNQEIQNVIQNIIKQIRPLPEELLAANMLVNKLSDLIKQGATKYDIIDIVPCGSIAKGTALKDDSDIDLFVRFNPEDADKLSHFAEETGVFLSTHLGSELTLPYAEHPYAKLSTCEGSFCFTVNIVPTIIIRKIKDLNATLKLSSMARTPLHTTYAIPKLIDLEDDVRLLKFFAKTKHGYGIFGLTGWLCELLIIHSGSFSNALQTLTELDKKPIIFNKSAPEELIKEKFSTDMIIIVDPVDPNRNAAAGIQGFIGKCIINRLQNAAKRGLDKPSEIFIPQTIKSNIKLKFQLLEKNFIESNLKSFLGGIINHLYRNLIQYDYTINDADFNIHPASIELRIEPLDQPMIKIQGPPSNLTSAVENFQKAHQDDMIIIENNRYIAQRESPAPTIEQAIGKAMPDLKCILSLEKITRKKVKS